MRRLAEGRSRGKDCPHPRSLRCTARTSATPTSLCAGERLGVRASLRAPAGGLTVALFASRTTRCMTDRGVARGPGSRCNASSLYPDNPDSHHAVQRHLPHGPVRWLMQPLDAPPDTLYLTLGCARLRCTCCMEWSFGPNRQGNCGRSQIAGSLLFILKGSLTRHPTGANRTALVAQSA